MILMACRGLWKLIDGTGVGVSAGIGYNPRRKCQTCPRSMKVVQLICNHQAVVRFRAGAPVKSNS